MYELLECGKKTENFSENEESIKVIVQGQNTRIDLT